MTWFACNLPVASQPNKQKQQQQLLWMDNFPHGGNTKMHYGWVRPHAGPCINPKKTGLFW